MKLVVIESPYAGAIEANTEYARRAMRDSLDRGEAPTASHLLYTQPGVLDEGIAGERALGIAAGFAWWQVAELVAFYVDRGWSPGMIAAYNRALTAGTPTEIRTIDPDPEPGA